ncbi:hypothetical protein V8G54_020038 [Vigna mungo]|uniref:Uncharacterized protein n=1 Tax=Vigna mungo TaxID=3915 RepID=A0AAQ3RUB5_VIGMU
MVVFRGRPDGPNDLREKKEKPEFQKFRFEEEEEDFMQTVPPRGFHQNVRLLLARHLDPTDRRSSSSFCRRTLPEVGEFNAAQSLSPTIPDRTLRENDTWTPLKKIEWDNQKGILPAKKQDFVTGNSNAHISSATGTRNFDSVSTFQFPLVSNCDTSGDMCLHLFQDAVSGHPRSENWLAIVFVILHIRFLELADKTYMLFLTDFVVSSGRRRE